MNSLGQAGQAQNFKYEAHGPTHGLSSSDQLLNRARIGPLDMARIGQLLFSSLSLLN